MSTPKAEKDLQVLVPLHLAPQYSAFLKLSEHPIPGSPALVSFVLTPVPFSFLTLTMR